VKVTFVAGCLLALLAATAAPAQSLRVTLLGTGSPQLVRSGPSILVEAGADKLLFDCGRGAAQQLFRLHMPVSSVERLFFTHLHSDHVVGFPDLWLTGGTPGGGGRKVPLRVWGPAGTQEMIANLEKAYRFDIHLRRDVDEGLPAQGVAIVAKDITEGIVNDQNGVKVTAFEVDHGPVKPAFGYRVDFDGRSVVLSGDTRFSENLIRASKGADLLIHEVIDPTSFRRPSPGRTAEQAEKIINHHTTPEQAGEVFARVKPKLAAYSHIVPGDAKVEDLIAATRKTYSGPLEVGEDLIVFEVGERIQVRRPPAR